MPPSPSWAEVYWDLEWTLQQQGFHNCYDKRLYGRLRDGHAGPIRGHLLAGLDYQDKLARFLENHDEPRAAFELPWPQYQAAAVITFLAPGLRFFYDGQFEGAPGPRADPSLPRPGRGGEPGDRCVLCKAVGCAEADCLSRRRVVADPTTAGLGGQLDLGRLCRLCLGRRGRQLPSITPATKGNADCRYHFRKFAASKYA
jgi:glycosidase